MGKVGRTRGSKRAKESDEEGSMGRKCGMEMRKDALRVKRRLKCRSEK